MRLSRCRERRGCLTGRFGVPKPLFKVENGRIYFLIKMCTFNVYGTMRCMRSADRHTPLRSYLVWVGDGDTQRWSGLSQQTSSTPSHSRHTC